MRRMRALFLLVRSDMVHTPLCVKSGKPNRLGRPTCVDLNKSSDCTLAVCSRNLELFNCEGWEIKKQHGSVLRGEIVHPPEPYCQEVNGTSPSDSSKIGEIL